MTDKKLDKILENQSNIMAEIQYLKGFLTGFLKGNNPKQNEELICDKELDEEGLELMQQLHILNKIEAEYIANLDKCLKIGKETASYFHSVRKSLDNLRESAPRFNNIDFIARWNDVLNKFDKLTNQK